MHLRSQGEVRGRMASAWICKEGKARFYLPLAPASRCVVCPLGPLSLSVSTDHLDFHHRGLPFCPGPRRTPAGSAAYSGSAMCLVLCPVTTRLFCSSFLCATVWAPVTYSDKTAPPVMRVPVFSDSPLGAASSKPGIMTSYTYHPWQPHHPKIKEYS